MIPRAFRKRRIALPHDHGSYALFLGPLAIGYVAGGAWHVACAYLLVAASAGFLMRQPLSVLALIRSGRRTTDDRAPACFWLAVYAAVAASHIGGLVLRDFGYVLHLAVPGALVAGWHLVLVLKRAERRQMLLEVLASGVLALAAPAAMWIGGRNYDPWGWLLWALLWAACALAIVHTYQRLTQRTEAPVSSARARLARGRMPLALGGVNVIGVLALGLTGVVPALLVLPYGIQMADVIVGTLRPAHGFAPKRIGVQQLVVFVLFSLTFMATWLR